MKIEKTIPMMWAFLFPVAVLGLIAISFDLVVGDGSSCATADEPDKCFDGFKSIKYNTFFMILGMGIFGGIMRVIAKRSVLKTLEQVATSQFDRCAKCQTELDETVGLYLDDGHERVLCKSCGELQEHQYEN